LLSVYGLNRRVGGAMAVELTQPNLSVRTQLKRTDASSSIFQLDVDFWIPPESQFFSAHRAPENPLCSIASPA